MAQAYGSTGTISGAVVFAENGYPASSVQVVGRAFTGATVGTTVTDASGHFRMDGLSPGTYTVTLQEPGYELVEETVRVDRFAPDLVLHLKRINARQAAKANFTVSIRELAIPGKARQAFEKGLERLAKNDSAGSLAHFTRAAAVFPDYYEAYYHIGVADMNLGREEEAEQAFQKAIDLSAGRYTAAQFGMGALFCQQGKFAEAERTIRWGLDRDSNSWTGHYLLAVVLASLNRLDEAEKRVQAAIFRKPDFPPAHLLLGKIRLRKRDYEQAMKELDAYFKLEPRGPMSNWARQIREEAQRNLFKSQEVMAPAREEH